MTHCEVMNFDLLTFPYDTFILVVKIHHFYRVILVIPLKLAARDE